MDVRHSKFKYLKEFLLGSGIFIFVLLVNHLIISASPIFFEQPPIYLANQKIGSFIQLLKIYLNPEMLYIGSIPYFRPSGHFLMYQILIPFLGWHNIKGLIIINLLFLALTGYFMIKLYQLLFPKLWIGGYIGFTVFMIHPALVLSRFMVMQFDYNYALFTTLGIYCFVLFCQKNNAFNKLTLRGELLREKPFKELSFRYFPLLLLSLIFYAIAITFKEGAIMSAGAFLFYFYLSFGSGYPFLKRIKLFFSNKQALQILILLPVIGITLTIYLSMQWAHVKRPFTIDRLENYIYYAQTLLGIWQPNECSILSGPKCVLFSFYTLLTWWGLCLIMIIASHLLFKNQISNSTTIEYKKSLLFLWFTAAIFLLLPLIFGGFSWHLVPTILFFSLSLGFGFEYLGNYFFNQKWCHVATVLLILMMAVDTINLNRDHFTKTTPSFMLTRNAILNPPKLQDKLNAESVLVVEESTRFRNFLFAQDGTSIEKGKIFLKENSYYIGDSFFPFAEQATWTKATQGYFLKPGYIYNGTVFRWAYLMPLLKEEVYPFRVEKMEKVPDDIIYNWLQHYDNIYAVGYDEQANWHDITSIFKKNLSKEKIRRHFIVNQYTVLSKKYVNGNDLSAIKLPIPNPQLCQLICDKNPRCHGFVLMMMPLVENLYICQFEEKIVEAHTNPCPLCVSYIKKSVL